MFFSKLSPPDWSQLPQIVQDAGATELNIKPKDVWNELEMALRNLPEIRKLNLYTADIQWKEVTDLMRSVNNKALSLYLFGNVTRCDRGDADSIKRLAALCKNVFVGKLQLSEGHCELVTVSEDESSISVSDVYLKSGEDVRRLQQVVSQYESWSVSDLCLTELSSDGWTLLPQLLETLDSVKCVILG